MKYWREVLHDNVMRAHEKWLFHQRIGDGRLVLRGESLGEARTSGMTFDYALVESCDLSGAQIVYAGFKHSEILSCTLVEASFFGSQFVKATLRKNQFDRTNLRASWFTEATIEECSFDEADLNMGNFLRASVTTCSFRGARLADTQVDHARFERCDFRGASLNDSVYGTHFIDCDFRGANFDRLRMKDTHFTRCKLANVSGKPIIEGSFELVDVDFSTKEPLADNLPRTTEELRQRWEQGT